MRTYEEELTWRRIQSFLPEYNRIDDACRPIEEYVTVGRFRLHVDHYVQEDPKGSLAIFHGVGGNGRLVEFLAVPFWKAGYEVICPDLPLYGLTEYQGTVSYQDWVECSVELCSRYLRDPLPFFTLGLSASGMLAYQVGCELKRVDGIMATCLLDQREKEVTKKLPPASSWELLGKPA